MLMCPFVTFTAVGLLTTMVLSNPLFFIRYSLPNVFSLSLVPSVPNLNHFALSPSLAYNGFLLLIVATPESLICNHVRPCPSPSPPSSPSAWCTSELCCLAWFFLVPRLQEMHHVPRFHLYLLWVTRLVFEYFRPTRFDPTFYLLAYLHFSCVRWSLPWDTRCITAGLPKREWLTSTTSSADLTMH